MYGIKKSMSARHVQNRTLIWLIKSALHTYKYMHAIQPYPDIMSLSLFLWVWHACLAGWQVQCSQKVDQGHWSTSRALTWQLTSTLNPRGYISQRRLNAVKGCVIKRVVKCHLLQMPSRGLRSILHFGWDNLRLYIAHVAQTPTLPPSTTCYLSYIATTRTMIAKCGCAVMVACATRSAKAAWCSVYIYIYILYMCLHRHIHIYTHTYMYDTIYITYTYTYIYVYICICTYIYICT